MIYDFMKKLLKVVKRYLKHLYHNKFFSIFGKKELIILIIVVLAGSTIGIMHAQHTSNKPKNIVLAQSQSNIPSQENTISYNPSSITANSIVNALNSQRTSKGLSKLNWITQLDNAALARVNYMIANHTASNTAGDPSADLTNAGYSANGWQLSSLTSSEYQNSSLSNIINQFTTGNDSNFGFTSSYSDIGVAVVPYTSNGIDNQEIVIFLASPYTGLSQQQINNELNALPTGSGQSYQTCGIDQTGVYPNCANETCPTGETGTYPDCYTPSCPFDYTGVYPNCIPPPPPPSTCQIITEPDGLSGLSCPEN